MSIKKQLEEQVKELSQKPILKNLLKHQLLQDNVLVAAVTFPQDEQVYRPDQYEDKPEFGLVLAVGRGRILNNGEVVPCPVQVGDFIVFGKYSSVKIRAEGFDFLFIRDEDIMSKYVE